MGQEQKPSIRWMKSTRGCLDDLRLEVRAAKGATLGRIIICGAWNIHNEQARTLLRSVALKISSARHGQPRLEALTACGGFLRFDWPYNIAGQPTFDELAAEAEAICRVVISPSVRTALQQVTKLLSFGIDSAADEDDWGPHAELVALLDLDANHYYWTGKCYPTIEQAPYLVPASINLTRLKWMAGEFCCWVVMI